MSPIVLYRSGLTRDTSFPSAPTVPYFPPSCQFPGRYLQASFFQPPMPIFINTGNVFSQKPSPVKRDPRTGLFNELAQIMANSFSESRRPDSQSKFHVALANIPSDISAKDLRNFVESGMNKIVLWVKVYRNEDTRTAVVHFMKTEDAESALKSKALSEFLKPGVSIEFGKASDKVYGKVYLLFFRIFLTIFEIFKNNKSKLKQVKLKKKH